MISEPIVSTRLLSASRGAVFAAFSDADALARWWGPAGFTNDFERFELRPGGAWLFTMRAPDGSAHRMVKEFVEVVPGERIVIRHLEPPEHRFTMTAGFADEGEGTRLTWTMRFDSPEEAARVRDAVLGANEQNFDRLEAHLAETDGVQQASGRSA